MFTMRTPEVNALSAQYTDAVIFGIEAHGAQQTTLDGSSRASTSTSAATRARRSSPSTAHGLQRAVRSGAYATTSESVLMELIRGKDHPSFKAISTILKETKDPDPLEPF